MATIKERLRAHKRRKRLRALCMLLALGAAAYGLWFGWRYIHQPGLAFGSVVIHGTNLLTEEEAIKLGGSEPPFNFFNVSAGRLQDALKHDIRFQNAKVAYRWPAGLEVTVEERQPALYVANSYRSYLQLDYNGIVMNVTTGIPDARAPLLVGVQCGNVFLGDPVGNDSVMEILQFLQQLDGDARGGAALSIRAATGKPIKYIGTGEKLDMLEPFHPDRMASRILGMGDVLSLIEKAEQHVDEEKAKKLEEKLKKNRFTLTDYYEQLVQLRGMGDLSQLAEMMPGGMGKQLAGAEIDPKVMAHTEAIILSMTPEERENPKLLGASRKKRVAAGCGLEVVDVNRLLKQFEMMQDLVKQMTRGRMPKGLGGFGGKGGMSRMHGFGRKKRFK